MSNDENYGRARPLIDVQSVMETSQQQVKEDVRELETKYPDAFDRLRKRQAWIDIGTLRLGALREDTPLDALLGGPFVPLRPSEHECARAAKRLARQWARWWRLHGLKLKRAARTVADRWEVPLWKFKEQLIQTTIFRALQDAQEPQVTNIRRDRAMHLGSELRLLQDKDLKQLFRDGFTDELIEKLSRPPAGLHVFSPYRLVSPIEAAFAGYEWSSMVRPTDLRLPQFHHWVRRRAIKHAEEWLRLEWLQLETGISASDDTLDQERVQVTQREMEGLLLKAAERSSTSQQDALIAAESVKAFDTMLDQATPSQRRILQLLRNDLRGVLNLTESKKSVTDLLGFGKSRIDVAFHNLEKRMKDPR